MATRMPNNGENKASPTRRRRTLVTHQKKITDDEFMAAAIGDVEWLKQSMKESRGQIHFDKNGLAAIHLAALHGRLECLRLLLEKYKVDIHLASSTGWQPIHLCISNQTGKRSFQCLAYLLEKGADPSCKNDDDITPVHQAASEGHVQCLKLLIEVGAKIDGRDCRGHLPIDLAKLWGHRNCARLLAAEQWHKEKHGVAKEMNQLRKTKMQQILKDLENEDDQKKEMKFYGDDAYKGWLKQKGLQPVPPMKKKNEGTKKRQVIPKNDHRSTGATDVEDWRDSEIQESLIKPNSVATGRSTMFGQMADSQAKGTISKAQVDTPGTYRSIQTPMTLKTEASTLLNIHEDPLDGEENEDESNEPPFGPFYNKNRWNKSTFVPGKEYVKNLIDAYPRDNYTRLPRPDAAPTSLVAPMAEIKEAGFKLPPGMTMETLQQRLRGNLSMSDRRVVYACQNIVDAQQKHKFHPDELKVKSEIGLHLMMDTMDSDIFVNSLQRSMLHDSSRSSGTNLSGASRSTGSSYPTDKVVNTMKMKLTKPQYYPAIKGDVYDINYGQFACL